MHCRMLDRPDDRRSSCAARAQVDDARLHHHCVGYIRTEQEFGSITGPLGVLVQTLNRYIFSVLSTPSCLFFIYVSRWLTVKTVAVSQSPSCHRHHFPGTSLKFTHHTSMDMALQGEGQASSVPPPPQQYVHACTRSVPHAPSHG